MWYSQVTWWPNLNDIAMVEISRVNIWGKCMKNITWLYYITSIKKKRCHREVSKPAQIEQEIPKHFWIFHKVLYFVNFYIKLYHQRIENIVWCFMAGFNIHLSSWKITTILFTFSFSSLGRLIFSRCLDNKVTQPMGHNNSSGKYLNKPLCWKQKWIAKLRTQWKKVIVAFTSSLYLFQMFSLAF